MADWEEKLKQAYSQIQSSGPIATLPEAKQASPEPSTYSWEDIKQDGREEFIKELEEIDMTDLINQIKEAAVSRKVPVPTELLNYDSHKAIGESAAPSKGKKTSKKPKIKKKGEETPPANEVKETSFVPAGNDNPEL